MNIKRLVPLYEQIILEYSEGFIKQQMARLKPQAGPYVTDQTIRNKIVRFDQLKTGGSRAQLIQYLNDGIANNVIVPNTGRMSPEDLEALKNINPKDLTPEQQTALFKYNKEVERIEKLKKNPIEISFYNWSDLELVVDQFPDAAASAAIKKALKSNISAEGSIYNENNLEVFLPADGGKAFLIKTKIIQYRSNSKNPNYAKPEDIRQTDRTRWYPWCIAADPAGANNLWDKYRFGRYGGDTPKSPYFVHDLDKPFNDKWHFMVIQVANNTPGSRQGKYYVTSALNDGDIWMSWDQVLQVQPKLQGLEHLFQFVPFTPEEEVKIAVGEAKAEDFKTFKNYDAKKAYVMAGKKIYKEDYLKLDKILQHLYINVRVPNAEDPNVPHMLRKLMVLFQNSDPGEMAQRVTKAKELGSKSSKDDKTFLEPLVDDPIIKQSKADQTYKRWRQLIIDTVTNIGAAKRAAEQKKAAAAAAAGNV